MTLMKKALFFIVPIVIYVIVVGIYNFQKLKRFHILDPKVETVIVGDSHLKYALNPDQLPSTVNYCTSAEALVLTFAKIKFLLDEEENSIKRILVPLGYHNITSAEYAKLNSKKWSNEMYKRSIPFIIPGLITVEMGYDKFQMFKMLLTDLALRPIDLDAQKLKTFGEFAPSRMNHLQKSNLDYAIGHHYYEEQHPLNYHPQIGDLLIEMSHYCQNRNVLITFINTPLHPDYLSKVPKQIKQDYDQLESELSRMFPSTVSVFRSEGMIFPDSAYLDFDHLNKHGAQIFGEFIKNELYDSE